MQTQIKIVNLTPHAIVLQHSDGKQTTFPAPAKDENGKQEIARVSVVSALIGNYAGADVFRSAFVEVIGLPAQEDGTYYIVSGMVLSELNGSRPDVIAPKTDDTAIRNEKGHVVAVTGWLA